LREWEDRASYAEGQIRSSYTRAKAPGVCYVKIVKAGFADENFKDLKVTAVENATVVVKEPHGNFFHSRHSASRSSRRSHLHCY